MSLPRSSLVERTDLSGLSKASLRKEFFSQSWPQKHAHENRGVKRASHVKYEPFTPSGTPSNRLLNDKTASNGLKNSLKVMFEANSRISMKKYKF